MTRLHFGNMVRVNYWCDEEDKEYVCKQSKRAKKKNPRMTDSEVFRQMRAFCAANGFEAK